MKINRRPNENKPTTDHMRIKALTTKLSKAVIVCLFPATCFRLSVLVTFRGGCCWSFVSARSFRFSDLICVAWAWRGCVLLPSLARASADTKDSPVERFWMWPDVHSGKRLGCPQRRLIFPSGAFIPRLYCYSLPRCSLAARTLSMRLLSSCVCFALKKEQSKTTTTKI